MYINTPLPHHYTIHRYCNTGMAKEQYVSYYMGGLDSPSSSSTDDESVETPEQRAARRAEAKAARAAAREAILAQRAAAIAAAGGAGSATATDGGFGLGAPELQAGCNSAVCVFAARRCRRRRPGCLG